MGTHIQYIYIYIYICVGVTHIIMYMYDSYMYVLYTSTNKAHPLSSQYSWLALVGT